MASRSAARGAEFRRKAGFRTDAHGLARSGPYTGLNQSISRVVKTYYLLLPNSYLLEQSLKCFELLSMDERLATVSEVEGRVGFWNANSKI